MATLQKRHDRKDWLQWAVQLLHRGVWAGDTIIIHGPHSPSASFMWGETDGYSDPPDEPYSGCRVTFRTASGIRGIYDIRGMRIWDTHRNTYPKLPLSKLTPKARRWLLVAERLLKKLTDAAIQQSRKAR